MSYSTRQFIFAEYLLGRIGFKDAKLISRYLKKLESIYGKYYKEDRKETFKNGYTRYYYVIKYSNSECIEELLKEIEVKKNANKITDLYLNVNAPISASDLSSYAFCPASYAISKSFKIDYPTSEDKRLTGIDLHETLRLINKKIPFRLKESDVIADSVITNEKIKKIKSCELIFSGHNSSDRKYFMNDICNYVGQPDYIFKDPNGKYFVVEEKFKYLNNYVKQDSYEARIILNERNKVKNTFHSNHIVQLQSYMEYIEEYFIDYGILIYWFYDFDNKVPKVHSVSLKIIKRNENKHLLNSTINDLKKFLVIGSMDFSEKVNPSKCAACTVNKYCGHKTDTIKELKFPYCKKDLYLKYVCFPEDL